MFVNELSCFNRFLHINRLTHLYMEDGFLKSYLYLEVFIHSVYTIYIYVCICTYVCTHTHMYLYTHSQNSIDICIFTFTDRYIVKMCRCVFVFMYE